MQQPPSPDVGFQLDAFREALGEILAEEQITWQRERALIEAQAARTIAELRVEIVEMREELGRLVTHTIDDLNGAFTARMRELRNGIDGKDGVPGPQGDIGPQGPPGERGDQGLVGKDGAPGASGERGETGLSGPAGERGEAGPPGERGEVGPQGPPGERGEQGKRGLDGVQGDRGEPGPIGERGEVGPTGERGEAGAVGKRGETGATGERGLPGEIGPRGEIGPVGARGETGPRGERGNAGEIGPRGTIGERGPIGERGEKGATGERGPEGRLTIAKEFVPGKVHYANCIVTHDGSLWQAKIDTGQTPPSDDWIVLATKGADGVDGGMPVVRGTWRASERYSKFDIVAIEGSAFIARQDAPGACPGDNWQLIAAHGRQGIKGPPGPRGERGETGPVIVSWKIDRKEYVITPILSDGSKQTPLNLRELFEQFNSEVQ